MAEEQNSEFRMPKLPKEGELLGVVEERLRSAKIRVSCTDGEVRICRIPGHLKRRVWVREGDIVLIKPWEIDNSKADLVWRYNRQQADYLRKNGYLKGAY